MSCRNCKTKPVIKLTNAPVKLCKKCFNQYFEKKVRKCIRVNKLIRNKDKISIKYNRDLKSSVLKFMLLKIFKHRSEDFKTNSKKYTRLAIGYSLDDEAEEFLQLQFDNKIKQAKKLGPSYKKTIKPLVYMLTKEIELFAKLNKIKYKKTKSTHLHKKLEELEQRYQGTKHAITNALKEIKPIFN